MPNDDTMYDNVITAIKGFQEELRLHRDTVFRAIGLLNQDIVGFAKRLDTDDLARTSRQAQIDEKLEQITRGQARIQRWQWVRVGIEVAAILIVIAFVMGMRQ
jgi:hypothetical protein